MKTNILKTATLTALVLIGAGISAQTKQKKACIKIVENVNGKLTNIDTCFTGLTDADIQKQLDAMGIKGGDIKLDGLMDSLNVIVNTEVGDDGDSSKSEVIMINGGEGKHGKVKIISNSNGKENVVETNGDESDAESDGNYAYSYSNGGSGKTKVMVKSGNGKSETVTVTTDGDEKDGKVYVYKKVIIKDISGDDKKVLPSSVNNSGTPFTDLKMSPNPTEGTVNIAYKSTSNEPLEVDVYDMNGKKVYNETVTNTEGQVNKTLTLNSFGPGIYFVHLLQGKQSEVRKIVVK